MESHPNHKANLPPNSHEQFLEDFNDLVKDLPWEIPYDEYIQPESKQSPEPSWLSLAPEKSPKPSWLPLEPEQSPKLDIDVTTQQSPKLGIDVTTHTNELLEEFKMLKENFENLKIEQDHIKQKYSKLRNNLVVLAFLLLGIAFTRHS
ncbi:hypothetical protein NHQ30_006168 [Ciborinia camelliae]|nr:hypothetical protein NHQ30_006168 [Ciborinia camelliae]